MSVVNEEPAVSMISLAVSVAMNSYQTVLSEAQGPAISNTSAVAPLISMLSAKGRAVMTSADPNESLGGGSAARAVGISTPILANIAKAMAVSLLETTPVVRPI